MFKLDDTFLVSVGLGPMPAEEKEAFLSYIYNELELRISMELAKNLTDELLAQFESLVETRDRAGAHQWLKQHCSDYQAVAGQELERLKQEIIAGRDLLLAS